MDIERLTLEIECTFRDYPIDQIPARIEWLEEYTNRLAKHLNDYIARQAAGKKMQRHQMVGIRQYPARIKEERLFIRALKEAYAYRVDA
jgi:hypothetical protein